MFVSFDFEICLGPACVRDLMREKDLAERQPCFDDFLMCVVGQQT